MVFNLHVIDWTAISAISTLIISLIAIILPIRRDKPHIRLKAMIGEIYPQGILYGAHLFMTIQNHGHRNVTITKWYAKLLNEQKKFAILLPISPQLPITIFPGQAVEFTHQEIVQDIDKNFVEGLYIEDSLDHVYKLKGVRITR
jgi:hypothetical protein